MIREWAATWLRAMRPGRWATEIDVASRMVVGFQKNRPLYGGYRSQATVFTWLYALTRKERYLEPFLHRYRKGEASYPSDGFLADAYTLGALDGLREQTIDDLARTNPALALYSLVVDPDRRVPEVYEGNNRVQLGAAAQHN